MGTRNLIAVQFNGEYKIAQYGQWDGYPEGQGATVLNFLKKVNMEEFKQAVSGCHYLTNDELKKRNVPNWQEIYPELSRDAGADILNLVLFEGKRQLKNSIDFAEDGLFCEWAYIIDLDRMKFEIYKGFNREPLSKDDRFYYDKIPDNGYYPVSKIQEYDISALPEEEVFIADCNGNEDDEECEGDAD